MFRTTLAYFIAAVPISFKPIPAVKRSTASYFVPEKIYLRSAKYICKKCRGMNLRIFLHYENVPKYALKFTTAEIYRNGQPVGHPFQTINSLDFIQPRLSVIVLRIVCSTLVCSFAAPLVSYRLSGIVRHRRRNISSR